jgi:hypothetical protein
LFCAKKGDDFTRFDGAYLFLKNQFEREKFVLFSQKIKNLKKTQKAHFSGFFQVVFFCFFGVFLGGFFNANLDQREVLGREVRNCYPC